MYIKSVNSQSRNRAKNLSNHLNEKMFRIKHWIVSSVPLPFCEYVKFLIVLSVFEIKNAVPTVLDIFDNFRKQEPILLWK
jgi:hypothetical protein